MEYKNKEGEKMKKILPLILLTAVFAGCDCSENCKCDEFNSFVELCRGIAKEPIPAKVEPEDPTTKVDWMVHPCTATTQEFKKDFKVVYADDSYLSYYAMEYSYTGGAHGTTTVSVGSLKRPSGETVKLSEFVPEEKMKSLQKALYDGVVKKLGSAENILGEVKVIDNFYIAKDGLHFVYNQYEVAPYAAGVIEIVIKPSDL